MYNLSSVVVIGCCCCFFFFFFFSILSFYHLLCCFFFYLFYFLFSNTFPPSSHWLRKTCSSSFFFLRREDYFVFNLIKIHHFHSHYCLTRRKERRRYFSLFQSSMILPNAKRIIFNRLSFCFNLFHQVSSFYSCLFRLLARYFIWTVVFALFSLDGQLFPLSFFHNTRENLYCCSLASSFLLSIHSKIINLFVWRDLEKNSQGTRPTPVHLE